MNISQIVSGATGLPFPGAQSRALDKSALTNLIGAVNTRTGIESDIKRVAAERRVLTKTEALAILDQADEGLSRAGYILQKMAELAELATDKMLDEKQRSALDEMFQSYKAQLDELSDQYAMLDGSFGGVSGAQGMLAMGIDSIASGGGIEGTAKFSIEQKEDGRMILSLRIGGETISNTITRGDTSTAFKLKNGGTITVGFSGGLSGLVTGVVTGVSFSAGQQEADLRRTLSADKRDKLVYVKTGLDEEAIKLPNMLDVSALGLSLNDLDLLSLAGAKTVLAAAERAHSRVNSMQEEVRALREFLLRNTVAGKLESKSPKK